MLIELKGIHKTYDNGQPLHVLKGIDLSIDNGEFVSIMGSSGSGKSTLLNIVGILDNYDEGEYHLDGRLIKGLKEREAADYRNRTIGFVFQSFNLIPFKTAVENVELPLFYQGVSRTKRREAAMQLLDKLGLANWAKHYPNEMSGGQKQRVAIARALITHPPRRESHHHRGHPRERRGQLRQQDRPHQGRPHRRNRTQQPTPRLNIR